MPWARRYSTLGTISGTAWDFAGGNPNQRDECDGDEHNGGPALELRYFSIEQPEQLVLLGTDFCIGCHRRAMKRVAKCVTHFELGCTWLYPSCPKK